MTGTEPQAWETGLMENVTYVGLDAHKATVCVAIQRTQCVNALRGHQMEYGYVFPKGITHVETLIAVVEDLQC
jgi:hypothetical protein